MIRIKWLFLCGLLLNVGQTWAACPNLTWWEFPPHSYSVVKRVNQWNINRNTIFFCKEPRPASHTEHAFTKDELIDNTPGEAPGTARYSMGSTSKSETLPLSNTTIYITNANPTNDPTTNNPIKDLNPVRFSKYRRTWRDFTLFHFYKRKRNWQSCSNDWNLSNSIRSYLQVNANIFTAKAPGQVRQYASSYGSTYSGNFQHTDPRIAIIKGVKLSHTLDNSKTIKGDMEFYWIHVSDDGKNKNPGGPIAGYRYCHFGVAVKLKIKTKGYNINSAGDYTVDVGVQTLD